MVGLIVSGVLGATGKPWWTPLLVLLATTAFTALMVMNRYDWWRVVEQSAGQALVINYAAYGLGRFGLWASHKLWRKNN